MTTEPSREPDLATKLRFLGDSAHLGEPGAPLERIETHFAWVFLTPRYVYKLRKPIREHGVDTSTLATRHARCSEELRINQPLAPGVYLDVLPLVIASDGRLAIGTPAGAGPVTGRAVDWLLRMRRLPPERMFDRMIRERAWQPMDLAALIEHLRTFYSRQPGLRIPGSEYCRRLGSAIDCNRDALLAAPVPDLDPSPVLEIAYLQRRWIEANRAVLGRRSEEGMVRDCHGDLKPEHVCFGPPVCVIDRLEFDAELRQLDPLEDMCLLWVECERLGAPDAGEWLLRHYVAPADPRTSSSLLLFYLSNRALVRARLAAWRIAEPGADLGRWLPRFEFYIERALRAMREAQAADHSRPSSSVSEP